MYSVFPSPLITWHRPTACAPEIHPVPSPHHHCLRPDSGVSSLGHCSPPAPGFHCIFQSHQSELENMRFDCAISLSRISQFLLTAYTMKSKLKYGFLECSDLWVVCIQQQDSGAILQALLSQQLSFSGLLFGGHCAIAQFLLGRSWSYVWSWERCWQLKAGCYLTIDKRPLKVSVLLPFLSTAQTSSRGWPFHKGAGWRELLCPLLIHCRAFVVGKP